MKDNISSVDHCWICDSYHVRRDVGKNYTYLTYEESSREEAMALVLRGIPLMEMACRKCFEKEYVSARPG